MIVNVILKEEVTQYAEDTWTTILSVTHSRDAAENFVKAQVDKLKKEMRDGGWAHVKEYWYDVHCCELVFEKNEIELHIDIHTIGVEALD